ncbi:hypothetical protein FisN_19Lh097 [Fistulifera solaris]|uniref:HSF-type DNA-binding domain-containing protein n=1 Tax=Fistulifera solaris TaxID=1519565 RepID=A0A1Z5J6T3_FISSO|nr:hypothetical protein FisN_19Lh097 [Fistulifera solaris]|eukprot:GAX09636.1 hypothetical protein FisN_19Lh097 [Fistulifera solaris]
MMSMFTNEREVSGIYRDYANVDLQEVKADLNFSPDKCKGPRGGVAVPFPVRLYTMLEVTKKEGFEHIVSWQVHGRCFMVHSPQKFVTDVLPRFFKHSKLSSFQRQLNLWGFQRVVDGIDRGGYYHELFLLGRPDLAKIMLRTRVRATSQEPKPWGQDDPDFYAYPFCKEDNPLAAVVSSSPSDDDSISATWQTWMTNCQPIGSYSHSSPTVVACVSPRESPIVTNVAPSARGASENKTRASLSSLKNGTSGQLDFVLKPLPRAPKLITPSALSKKVFGHSLAQFEGQTFQCIDNCSLASVESVLISEGIFW